MKRKRGNLWVEGVDYVWEHNHHWSEKAEEVGTHPPVPTVHRPCLRATLIPLVLLVIPPSSHHPSAGIPSLPKFLLGRSSPVFTTSPPLLNQPVLCLFSLLCPGDISQSNPIESFSDPEPDSVWLRRFYGDPMDS